MYKLFGLCFEPFCRQAAKSHEIMAPFSQNHRFFVTEAPTTNGRIKWNTGHKNQEYWPYLNGSSEYQLIKDEWGILKLLSKSDFQSHSSLLANNVFKLLLNFDKFHIKEDPTSWGSVWADQTRWVPSTLRVWSTQTDPWQVGFPIYPQEMARINNHFCLI